MIQKYEVGFLGIRTKFEKKLLFFEMSKLDSETLVSSSKHFRVCSSSDEFSLLILKNEPFKPIKIFCPETNKYVYNVSNLAFREVMLMEKNSGRTIFFPENLLKDDTFVWV